MANYTVQQQVEQIYIGLLGRAADKPGLEYWVGQIGSGALTIEQLRANIVNEQPEYAAGLGGMTRAQVVSQLYEHLFERAAEPTGLEYWVNGGGSTVNIDQLVLAMTDGAGAGDRLVLDNKVEAATYYTNQAGADFTRDAAAAAVEDVGSTRASVDASKAATDSGAQTSGETFTLTVGEDSGTAFTGGASNDTFSAPLLQDNIATAVNSLEDFDVLDGGEGADTLKVTLASSSGTGDVAPILSNIETVNVRFTGTDNLTLANSSDVDTVNVSQSTAANTVKGLGTVGTLNVSNQTVGATFTGSTATALALGVSDVSKAATVDLDDAKATSLTLNLGSLGNKAADGTITNVTLDQSAATATAVTANLTGSNYVDFNTVLDAAKTLTVNGSGSLTAAATNTDIDLLETLTVAGGASVDVDAVDRKSVV